ncbi:MAG TPA: hypothetical protein VG328_10245 [Stellaceae bacterium]|nr:hypothetical protein [Stellaceae bacterium]
MTATMVLALLAACSPNGDRANSPYSPPMRSQNAQSPNTPFSNGLRTNQAQPTNCSPADSTCGSGVGNPAVQSPIQKREEDIGPGQ